MERRSRSISVTARWLLGIALAALVISMIFTYRWYDNSSFADRVVQPGQCPKIYSDGCKAVSRISDEVAGSNLRVAMAGFVVMLVSGTAAVFVIWRDSEPTATTASEPDNQPSDIVDPSDRLKRLDEMKADGLLTDTEYDYKRRDILDDI